MTLDPALESAGTDDAIIEGVALKRRKEEGPRVFVTFSFPRRSARGLHDLLSDHFQNNIRLIIQPFQATLPEAPKKPEGEEVTMVVDGEPAKVRRPRNNPARNGAIVSEDPDPLGIVPDPDLAKAEAEAAAAHEAAAEQELAGLSGTARSLIEEAKETPALPY